MFYLYCPLCNKRFSYAEIQRNHGNCLTTGCKNTKFSVLSNRMQNPLVRQIRPKIIKKIGNISLIS